MGWFENSGVMDVEQPNNYRFHTVLDMQTVRRVLFQRDGSDINLRLDERVDVERELYVTIVHGESEFSANSKDVSGHGLRLQLVDLTEMEKGDSLTVKIKKNRESDKVDIEFNAQVMWVARVGTRRIVTNLGIGFTKITDEEQHQLKLILLDEV